MLQSADYTTGLIRWNNQNGVTLASIDNTEEKFQPIDPRRLLGLTHIDS